MHRKHSAKITKYIDLIFANNTEQSAFGDRWSPLTHVVVCDEREPLARTTRHPYTFEARFEQDRVNHRIIIFMLHLSRVL
jgi:hypothetical protein